MWGEGYGKCESKHRVKGESLRDGDDDDDEIGLVEFCVSMHRFFLSLICECVAQFRERKRDQKGLVIAEGSSTQQKTRQTLFFHFTLHRHFTQTRRSFSSFPTFSHIK